MSGLPPDWAPRLEQAARSARHEDLTTVATPATIRRRAAVLVLFGPGPDVLLTLRAGSLRAHAGQVSFPGGSIDDGDAGPTAAALREAVEETGLSASGVRVAGELPELYVPPSGYLVVPVVAFWDQPTPVAAVDPAEVVEVARVPLADLLDPANRCTWMRPGGRRGPAFTVHGWFVWGFTAGLLSRLLALAGLERDWDRARVVELTDGQARP